MVLVVLQKCMLQHVRHKLDLKVRSEKLLLTLRFFMPNEIHGSVKISQNKLRIKINILQNG